MREKDQISIHLCSKRKQIENWKLITKS